LVTGDKLVVREAAPDVHRRVLEYRRALLHPGPNSSSFDSQPESSAIEPPAQESSHRG
jgi:hypothetical protein